MATTSDTLRQLTDQGVAIWLDDMSRARLSTGTLADLIRDKHVVGATTNPTIFQKALDGSAFYDEQVTDLARRGVDVEEAVRMITTYDVRWACDVFAPVYEASDGIDGRVSIEVDPRLAHETETTIAEARQLWWLVDRPNLFIKIPATKAGLPAIAQCIAEGISINVTLDLLAGALRRGHGGLPRRPRAGPGRRTRPLAARRRSRRSSSAASTPRSTSGSTRSAPRRPRRCKGKAAIANARLAYQLYEEVFGTDRWTALADAGGLPQRPLWASTGVKDPAYDDTMYVVDLVAPGVVNTMPEATLNAVADHGVICGDTIRPHYAHAKQVLDDLAAIGIDYDDVVQVLEDEAVEKFEVSWNELLESTKSELTRLATENAK